MGRQGPVYFPYSLPDGLHKDSKHFKRRHRIIRNGGLGFFLTGGSERLLICFPIMESCQGICKVLIAIWKACSWMSTYIRCHVYASTHACVHKTILLCKESACWHFFFVQATQQSLITHTWTVPLCAEIVVMRVVDVGGGPWEKHIQLSFHHGLPRSAAAPSIYSSTPGFSAWHIFSHSSFCFMISTPSSLTFFPWHF